MLRKEPQAPCDGDFYICNWSLEVLCSAPAIDFGYLKIAESEEKNEEISAYISFNDHFHKCMGNEICCG